MITAPALSSLTSWMSSISSILSALASTPILIPFLPTSCSSTLHLYSQSSLKPKSYNRHPHPWSKSSYQHPDPPTRYPYQQRDVRDFQPHQSYQPQVQYKSKHTIFSSFLKLEKEIYLYFFYLMLC